MFAMWMHRMEKELANSESANSFHPFSLLLSLQQIKPFFFISYLCLQFFPTLFPFFFTRQDIKQFKWERFGPIAL